MGMDGKFGTGVRSRGAAKNGAWWERTLACGHVVTGGGTTGSGGPSIPPPLDKAMCFDGDGLQEVVSAVLHEAPRKKKK